MMKLQTYAAFSFLATMTAIYNAFSSRGQFYPAMVYLSLSKICFVLLLNMGLVMMCIAWKFIKCLFLGTLREAEVERLNEQSWREVMEILFAITIFRQDFSVTFLSMVTALLLIKALHWLAQKRVEYIETSPTVPTLSHIRIISFMGFLLFVDCLFFYTSLKSLMQTWQAPVSIFFFFEYAILATTTATTFIKYVFYLSDMLMDGQWEKKAIYSFYLELVRELVHLSMYILFFLLIFVNYGVPLHLIHELYETFRRFRIRISDYIRYRKITSNMNERFPDATPEELIASDATCIICREEMVTAKKLVCGHLFHVHCLRSWLERQHTCPTCRALVVPPESNSSAPGRQQRVPSDRQTGAAVAGTSEQSTNGGTENFHQPQGYPVMPKIPQTEASSEAINDPNSEAVLGPSQQNQSIFPDSSVDFFHVPCSAIAFREKELGNPNYPLNVEENLIHSQIELLQGHLTALQQPKAEQSKRKAAASSSGALAPDCGCHGQPEEVDID